MMWNTQMLLHLKKKGPNGPKYPSKGIFFFTQASQKVLTGILTLETHPITYGSHIGTLLRSPFNREGFPVAQTVNSLPAVRETRVRSLGWEDPLEKEMATHSSILAWRIPWTEETGRL